ncbi:DUF2284 domain-containing protein [Desulfosporosinus metallidurans]|uniref:Metal-binding protein n=1 Tax=Desulfosporosinus metallidurans TaxID=1888891 RepID=A0A1Q8QR95_9FIRM|nr:DUF2284 domain-containing protein [Desulfosporosinus metallidurans]OLN29822.1 hypothetical protein DSOL_3353 [Desulfosporosinus metallidurans]
MNVDIDDLVRDALALGVTHAAIATVADIKFNEDFRTQCEQNACGTYNKNWMCPPAVGQIAELKEKVLGFKQGLLIQTVHELKSSFDWKGMMASGHKHTEIFRTILDKFDIWFLGNLAIKCRSLHFLFKVYIS